jgi:hypothetical protein
VSGAAAIVGPLVGILAKALLARRNARAPLYVDCLGVVATLRQGTDIDILHVTEEAEYLMKAIAELDNVEDLEKAVDILRDDYGGEQ